ncbi:hypothetical protein SteCoe_25143 [Stentor coeruleus]|uniref:Guanylate cyclase domain-containing protein n=1 Tax=Stentor coeruleus TaxID=5963 RepID=A0A1R2BFW9_9CILI|nr:hypothetical protein SteCoe_25143 [Stentor coeruleus]
MRMNKSNQARKPEKESLYRRIDFLHNMANEYKDNRVVSYHYTILSLIPKTLFQEFQNISYLWFLTIIGLELSPYCEYTSLKWSTLFPLLLLISHVLTENILRTYNRYKLDSVKNNAIVQVLGSSDFLKKKSRDVHVGDILLIENQEHVPADVLLLAVDNTESECFVDMSAVIGGKDLIKKKPVKDTQAFITTDGYEVGNLLKHIENVRVIQPDSSFKHFSGKIKMKGNPKVTKVNLENLVIRGTKVIGCNWIIGLAVYTGMETKLWLNSKKNRIIKISKFHMFVNSIMIVNFGILLFYTFLSFGLSYNKNYSFNKETWDIFFVNHLLLFNSLVPVSLYLAIRLSKFLQMLFTNLRYPNIQIKSSKIFENLGKIEYILLGKSGTLTEDHLKVQTCIIGSHVYRENDENDEEDKAPSRENGSEIPLSFDDYNHKTDDYCTFDMLLNELKEDQIKQEIWYFVLCLSICNHFYPNQEMKNISADEKVMVALAEELGLSLFHRASTFVILKYGETEYKYDILGCYGLYSEQKFNKILIKNRDSNEIVLLVKGNTDSIQHIFEDEDEIMSFEDGLKSRYLANLRKIVCGYKIFDEKTAKDFLFDYKNAKLSPVNVEGRVASVFEKYEKSLKYLGFIGIENPIKKGTKDCVTQLNKAGIKTWMVTGDSEESSLLTGLATGMYTRDSNIVRVSNFISSSECLQLLNLAETSEIFHQEAAISEKGSNLQLSEAFYKMNKSPYITKAKTILKDTESTRKELIPSERQHNEGRVLKLNSNMRKRSDKRKASHHLLVSLSNLSDEKIEEDIKSYDPTTLNFILSVDSNGLEFALSSSSHRKKFVSLLFAAKSVFFHSMSPDQKIKIVRLLKHNFSFHPTIMAIGDGNTNSGMLGEADISITVALNDAEFEYAPDARVEKFLDLSFLILKIGHYSQVRISRLVLLIIYREMLINTFMFLFQTQTNFSGTPLFSYDIYVIYELFITLIPLICVGVFYKDQSVMIQTLSEGTFRSKSFLNDKEEYPANYMSQNLYMAKIVTSYFSGCFHGILIFIATIYGSNNIINSKGFTEDLGSKEIIALILLSVAFSIKIGSENLQFLRFNVLMYFLTIVLLIITVGLALNGNLSDPMLDFSLLTDSATIWFIICFVPGVIFLLSMFYVMNYYKIGNLEVVSRLEQYKNNLHSVFKDSQEWNENEISNELELNKYSTKFLSKFKENHYQTLIIQENKNPLRIAVIFLTLISWIIYIIRQTNTIDNYKSNNITLIAPILMSILSILLFYKNLIWEYFSMIFFIVSIIFSLTQTTFNTLFTVTRYPILGVFFTLCINYRLQNSVIILVLTYIISIIIIFIESYSQNPSDFYNISLHSVILMLGICFLTFIITYINDINKRNEFVYLQKVEIEVLKTKNVLSYLLPQFVRKRVKDGVRYIAEDKGTVSVIFCDMCNFDDIVTLYTPQELTCFLDEIFGKLDKICEAIGVTKIETVGKTYLACAGLKDSEITLDPVLSRVPHARRAVEMGLAVLREISKIYLKDGSPLMFKIGINSGPVTAGVVGFHKPQFSLVGDTVNTASRMSSTLSDPNSIQISMSAYDLLGDKNGLTFFDRCPDVKGKGKMDTKVVEVPKQTISDLGDKGISGSSIGHNMSLHLNSSFKATSGNKIMESPVSLNTPTILNGLDVEAPEELIKEHDSKYVSRIITFYEKETSVEFEFRSMFLEDNYKIQYYGILGSIVINALLLLLEMILLIYDLPYSYPSNFIIIAIEELFTVLMFIRLKRYYKNKVFAYVLTGVFGIEFIGFFISSFFDKPLVVNYILFFDFRFLLINYCTGIFFGKTLVFNVVVVIFWMMIIGFNQVNYMNFGTTIVFIIVVLGSKYIQESRLRINSIIKQAAGKDVEKTEELLTQMMPPNALKNLQDENPTTDRLSYVTLMYADIVGFTAWSSTKTSKEVVGMLSQLFTRFDKLCLMHDVYKVHTIGDCYVVMGYKTDHKRNPAKEAENVVKFANSLIDVIEETNQLCNCDLSMRIGIHTGEVIGGITGTNIVRYDIYGADVLIANKMESNGEPGKIVVSEMTKVLLEDYNPDRYKFTQTKEISIPALNKIAKIFLLTDLTAVLDNEQ